MGTSVMLALSKQNKKHTLQRCGTNPFVWCSDVITKKSSAMHSIIKSIASESTATMHKGTLNTVSEPDLALKIIE